MVRGRQVVCGGKVNVAINVYNLFLSICDTSFRKLIYKLYNFHRPRHFLHLQVLLLPSK